MLFDAHTHLNFGEFTPEYRAQLAGEIEASDLSYIIDSGDSVESSRQAVEDSARYPWCYAAVGLHPDQAPGYTDEMLDEIEQLAGEPKVQAIGEIGMDLHYGRDSKEKQIELFRKEIRMANRLRLPIQIHTRDADRLTMDILIEEGAFSDERKGWFPEKVLEDGRKVADPRVQLHCFSGSAEFAMEYVRLGAMISVGGPVTFKNGRKTVEVVQTVPLDHLLSETDAPYLTPVPYRGRENKPYYVEHVVRRVALLKGLKYEAAARRLTENGKTFFNIDD
ncbi:MAG: TatD family hydrolase [Mobilibacterium timonense]|uniref:TatD family hydrolase n=1 Tax=Mobilibacterium timonense TaxID=1871012 RepID=UPI002354A715|nr:TatD family hydrolase [Mobilibacterium timonense]MBM6990245.1 TatD family hydrolase [Mobilibacterium timonense]